MSPCAWVVQRTDGPDLHFRGDLAARVDSRDTKADRSQWTVLELYRTTSGRWVAVRYRHRDSNPRPRTVQAVPLNTDDQVVEWVGWGRLGKALLEQAGISRREVVD